MTAPSRLIADLSELMARLEAPRPLRHSDYSHEPTGTDKVWCDAWETSIAETHYTEFARFICAAYNELPRLLERLEKAEFACRCAEEDQASASIENFDALTTALAAWRKAVGE